MTRQTWISGLANRWDGLGLRGGGLQSGGHQNGAADVGFDEGLAAEGLPGGAGLLDGLSGIWQWDELAAEINLESQARVALVGLAGVGKRMLFNRLRGWVVSYSQPAEAHYFSLRVEPYGLFVLADLPEEAAEAPMSGEELLLSLGDPALVVYVLDGTAGVRQADFRWVSLLRAGGRPVLVVLNKCDELVDVAAAVEEAQHRLGMRVIPISADTGLNVEELFLPALLDSAPKLAVPLGREILKLRRLAARRIIRQAATLTGLLGLQPVPLLDLPFQAMLQAGVVLRVGAAYGQPPTGGLRREVLGAIAGTLGARYLAQVLIKLVPLLGWVLSGVLGVTTTMLIGEAAIQYYEAGGRVPLPRLLRR